MSALLMIPICLNYTGLRIIALPVRWKSCSTFTTFTVSISWFQFLIIIFNFLNSNIDLHRRRSCCPCRSHSCCVFRTLVGFDFNACGFWSCCLLLTLLVVLQFIICFTWVSSTCHELLHYDFSLSKKNSALCVCYYFLFGLFLLWQLIFCLYHLL